MNPLLSSFLVGLLTILVIDITYLQISVPLLYRPGMGVLMKPVMYAKDIAFGALAWSLLVFGILYFVVMDALSLKDALFRGGLFGMVVYSVYNLTNKSSLLQWGNLMMVVDTMWGSLLSAAVAGSMFHFGFALT